MSDVAAQARGFPPTVGSGHPLADVFLLKYCPRYLEVSEGVSFFGRAGAAILKSVERLNVDPLLLYGTNMVKCAGVPAEQGHANCPAFFREEFLITQPKVIVVMGESALEVLNRNLVAGQKNWSGVQARSRSSRSSVRRLSPPT